MPVVKCKPTSPGRRFVVKVVNPDLHKGKPCSPLTASRQKLVVEITKGALLDVTRVVAINRNTGL